MRDRAATSAHSFAGADCPGRARVDDSAVGVCRLVGVAATHWQFGNVAGMAARTMKHPADMNIGERIALTIVIVLVILFAMAAFGYFSGGWEAAGQYRVQPAMPRPPTSKWESRLITLDRDAADTAYTEHLKKLILTALAAGDTNAFDRALVGARNTRKAYIAIMDAIEKREREVEQAK